MPRICVLYGKRRNWKICNIGEVLGKDNPGWVAFHLAGNEISSQQSQAQFYINTSITSKQNTSKGSSSGQRSGWMPSPKLEETMTEQELFEWLQKAVQAGEFDNYSSAISNDSPSAKAGNGPKSSGGGSSSSNKRKKRGRSNGESYVFFHPHPPQVL